ncbi:UDP-N-acetylglucosamine pyrophosphorylase [Cutibacterium avidum]|uniref:UDP-N-acetylglucosamine pyrophosphorylase n=1 Tax=Cutibacterium avidum TaxID=33010 RepID=UPI00080FBE28|nr:UDP-N-acetylglucosamine pyrophosphorylase [Cutibacterium avidum]MDU7816533.1 UDP-N-acetylglucosamine pyrophosphorylase [Bacillota bacterium]OCK15173.1 UDP-N-acetylglucosamine pyrophosphorylase [Cutibacterium avidum]
MDVNSPALQPRGLEKVAKLIDKGARIPNPLTVDIDDDVDVDNISGDGVVVGPGCRIRGRRTVISAGCVLGDETPMTIQDCQLGTGVKLKGGFAQDAVFLAGANMASGAHVRGGTILEEEASGAHTVGLKQTVLMPFVTLGSLINFCDVLMAGGTSRSNHSEVGSSYIHFNFTPDGDKTTASLFGDVPHGVLLNQHPIFLGGQGGTVGPVETGFGTVVGAGSILRDDITDDDQLVLAPPPAGRQRPVTPASYAKLDRIIAHNVTYLGNLSALEAWYRQIRRLFMSHDRLSGLVWQGALDNLASARAERVKRLESLVGKLRPTDAGRAQLIESRDVFLSILSVVDAPAPADVVRSCGAAANSGAEYLDVVQGFDEATQEAVIEWLGSIVSTQQSQAQEVIDQLPLPF